MLIPADPIVGVAAFLKSDVAVAARAGARGFGGELPAREAESMPRATVVVKPAGGGLIGASGQAFGDTRLDVDCYAATPHDAWLLYLDVAAALGALRRRVYAGALLHWARPSARGTLARDPDTDWPIAISSWQLLASDPVPERVVPYKPPPPVSFKATGWVTAHSCAYLVPATTTPWATTAVAEDGLAYFYFDVSGAGSLTLDKEPSTSKGGYMRVYNAAGAQVYSGTADAPLNVVVGRYYVRIEGNQDTAESGTLRLNPGTAKVST